ncbi:DNA sulfur modification protein DndB [Sinorhizobium fredii]|uniref:DNA sulfur modification protein DndB n=1 Tax=Rhizobium fredii TaxID=380 RepID=UPI0004AF1C1A|nr:DNA sulfur modification protein DndB [Sinorhizobium fredii]ASY70313.1 DNA sulfur modification protein DndB [Sinorhizobium fredii CCBAU 83666]
MSTFLNPDVNMKLYPNFADAVNAAVQFAFGNHAHHFEGTLFQQGGRFMFSTAMPFERFVQVAEANSTMVRKRSEKRDDQRVLIATEGDAVDDVADTTNRPVDRGHVRAITKYLTNAVSRGEHYIMPPATLNLRDESVTLFTLEGESTIKPAVLVLPPHARFEITDAQHRRQGISEALEDANVRRKLLRDGIAVMVTFENELSQVHQDFADASKTKPIAGSLVAVYDGRLPVNALAIYLARNCPLFRHTVDATSKGSSLSAGSVKVWNTNVLRQFVKYAGLNSREGDDGWNSKFMQVYGDQDDPRCQQFRDYLVHFIEACAQHIPLLNKLVKLSAEDMSNVPKLRAKDGGQVLMTAPGMNVLGALAHDLYRAVYRPGQDIEPWIKKLAAIDWSYAGAVWQDTLIIGGKMSTSAKAVKEAIAAVEKQIGLDSLQGLAA